MSNCSIEKCLFIMHSFVFLTDYNEESLIVTVEKFFNFFHSDMI